MNSKLFILTLVILSIQLIDASSIKDKNYLETDKVSLSKKSPFNENETKLPKKKRMIDTQSLSFSESVYFEIGDHKVQQLQCVHNNDEETELCSKYKASNAICINLNYNKEEKPSFTCKLSGQSISNKNVLINYALISCAGITEDNPTEYNLPARCLLAYSLIKNAEYSENDDINHVSTGTSIFLILVIIIVILALFLAGFIAYKKRN